MVVTLTEQERFTMAYVLYALRRSGTAPDTDNPEGVIIDLRDHISDDEFFILWHLGLRLMEVSPK